MHRAVLPGGAFLTSSMGACCLACQENPGCNVWAYNTEPAVQQMYSYSQCSLKYQAGLGRSRPLGHGGQGESLVPPYTRGRFSPNFSHAHQVIHFMETNLVS